LVTREGSLFALQDGLDLVDDGRVEALFALRLEQPSAEPVEQLVGDADLEVGQTVDRDQPELRPVRSDGSFHALAEAHRPHLHRRRRGLSTSLGGTTSCESCRICLATGDPGSSLTTGVPTFMDSGISRLDGIMATMGQPTASAASVGLMPTLASARLSTK